MEAGVATVIGAAIAAIAGIAIALVQARREPNAPRISRVTFWQSIVPPFGMGLFWVGLGIVMEWQAIHYIVPILIPSIFFAISVPFLTVAYRRFVRALAELEPDSKSKISN
jgi:hypothetical protein